MDVASQGKRNFLCNDYVMKGSFFPQNVADPTILNELNMACLRAAVKLLERLELKVQEPSNTADDSLHVVSRLFNKYSTALLASIESIEGGNNDGLVCVSPSNGYSCVEFIRSRRQIVCLSLALCIRYTSLDSMGFRC